MDGRSAGRSPSRSARTTKRWPHASRARSCSTLGLDRARADDRAGGVRVGRRAWRARAIEGRRRGTPGARGRRGRGAALGASRDGRVARRARGRSCSSAASAGLRGDRGEVEQGRDGARAREEGVHEAGHRGRQPERVHVQAHAVVIAARERVAKVARVVLEEVRLERRAERVVADRRRRHARGRPGRGERAGATRAPPARDAERPERPTAATTRAHLDASDDENEHKSAERASTGGGLNRRLLTLRAGFCAIQLRVVAPPRSGRGRAFLRPPPRPRLAPRASPPRAHAPPLSPSSLPPQRERFDVTLRIDLTPPRPPRAPSRAPPPRRW